MSQPNGAQAAPRCNHEDKVVTSTTTLVRFRCGSCDAANLTRINECVKCKRKLCARCKDSAGQGGTASGTAGN
ncbi:hypothetical protein BAUCODRAFT_150254 [Baudoinia panamericana UAMH 10762]|uniref:Uncharacterized protein n=1 Tax=Baudoinia panamericana (strain UAMH 10762) TaxID=717646 RepID=M2N4U7_BAUPA|nr:uncharacterized protein BAUCODRAFT_150254 [Baudoinia panamericana UAMH 10762]EMC94029.1 hypothetical protein BAUCODRAFT_150254 [Baudoinia panamericana UAMH 10762]